MKKVLLSALFISLLTVFEVNAQELNLDTIQFGTDVENRELVGVDSTFASSIGTVFCYTHLTGAEDSTEIAHVWYYQEEEKARVTLGVRSSDWRTWSSKKIQSSWVGEWTVRIEDADGNVLGSSSFIINEN